MESLNIFSFLRSDQTSPADEDRVLWSKASQQPKYSTVSEIFFYNYLN